MGRGPKPAKPKEAKPSVARKSPKSDGAKVRDLEKRLVEAQEQQTATSEILRVISESPSDVRPVFEVIAAHACRLCDGVFANVIRFDGTLMHNMAENGFTAEARGVLHRAFPSPPSRSSMSGRAILAATVVYVEDVTHDMEPGVSREVGGHTGHRAMVSVPMLRNGTPVGAITVARLAAGRFTERQVNLLKTFADQAVIAIENVRLFTELQEKNQALTVAHALVTESLEQQTATSEILRAISSSPTDVQPVFEAIVRSAVRLCNARFANVFRLENDVVHLAAHHNVPFEALEHFRRTFPQPLSQGGTLTAHAMRQGTVVHIHDVEAQSDVAAPVRALTRSAGYRTVLAVPILRPGNVVGAIGVGRSDVTGAPWPFSDKEVALLQTFADQAVIAIENVRLFKELETRNRDLTTALDRQTATSEILRVISGSPTDVQPVFDAIARNAVTLCGGIRALVMRSDGVMLHVGGHHNIDPDGVEQIVRAYPRRAGRDTPVGRALLERSLVHVPDLQAAASEFADSTARRRGVGSMLVVPLLREQEAVGVISLAREVVGPFSPEQIEVLRTFADQAVIAIENVRLFKELEARNAQLTELLGQQTATGEILSVIARSPTDIQPVFDTVVESAARLCEANDVAIYRSDGDRLRFVAHHGSIPPPGPVGEYFRTLERGSATGRSVLEGRILHIADLQAEADEFPTGSDLARRLGFRALLSVPLMRGGAAIGTIMVRRTEARLFSERQVALLQTFADQAVIAIENVRLFTELQEKNRALTEAHAQVTETLEQQTATSEILQTIAQAQTDVQPVFETIVRSAAQLCHASSTALSLTDGHVLYAPANYGSSPEVMAAARANFPRPLNKETVSGTAILTRSVVQVPDIEDPSVPELVRQVGRGVGFRSLFSVPMLRQGEAVGAITVNRRDPGSFSDAEVTLLQTFADQAVIAIENVRLFKELGAANRELAAASQHKSEFLANMSHELRTPLNAIIGFSEVLSEKMFGELNEKQEEYSKDIHASGQHLLSLINDILDLSKIEAGRMELELTDFDLPTALDSALTLVRERAGRRSIALHLSVDERLGQIQGDERKVRQVVLNLLSNAIKFTPEGGRIEVRATPQDGLVEVSVTDTGVGIAPEDQEAVFEEFRQVGTADKKVEGTGLGLTLCRKFVELHGGRIWVKSELGKGSTFTFTIPVRRGE